MGRRDIQDLGRAELESWCAEQGEVPYRARQVLAWVHRHGATRFEEMANLPKLLRRRLAEEFDVGRTRARATVARASDGTRKLLFQLPAGPSPRGRPAAIESVLIPQVERPEGARDRLTLCISSQAGCGMGCGFCATARMGLVRNLRPAEIVGQVRAGAGARGARAAHQRGADGHGRAARQLRRRPSRRWRSSPPSGGTRSPRDGSRSRPSGWRRRSRASSRRRGSTSRCRCTRPTDRQRERLVPVNRRYPLAALLAACREVPLPRRKRITFEYVMLAGENDADGDARALVRLLHGLRAKVNLIPFNPFPDAGFIPSPRGRVLRFQAILRQHGLSATIRESRGQDIQAACGQLAIARPAA